MEQLSYLVQHEPEPTGINCKTEHECGHRIALLGRDHRVHLLYQFCTRQKWPSQKRHPSSVQRPCHDRYRHPQTHDPFFADVSSIPRGRRLDQNVFGSHVFGQNERTMRNREKRIRQKLQQKPYVYCVSSCNRPRTETNKSSPPRFIH